MQLFAIQRIVGRLLTIFSLTMLLPAVISWWYRDGALTPFLAAFSLILIAGLLLWLPVRKLRHEVRLRDGFLIVVMFWVALGISGSVPLFLIEDLSLSLTDSVFEGEGRLEGD